MPIDWFKLLVYLFYMILHCCKLIYTCLWDVFRYWTADACCCQARLTDERLCGIWKSGKWCVFWVIFVFLSLNPLSWMEFEVHWGLDNFPPWDIWQIWVELVDLLFCSEDRRLTVTVIYVFYSLNHTTPYSQSRNEPSYEPSESAAGHALFTALQHVQSTVVSCINY